MSAVSIGLLNFETEPHNAVIDGLENPDIDENAEIPFIVRRPGTSYAD